MGFTRCFVSLSCSMQTLMIIVYSTGPAHLCTTHTPVCVRCNAVCCTHCIILLCDNAPDNGNYYLEGNTAAATATATLCSAELSRTRNEQCFARALARMPGFECDRHQDGGAGICVCVYLCSLTREKLPSHLNTKYVNNNTQAHFMFLHDGGLIIYECHTHTRGKYTHTHTRTRAVSVGD